VYSQSQGHTFIYSPPRAYYVDWMDVKAIYVKEEEEKLYFYIEYYSAIPNSRDYWCEIDIDLDTDRSNQTGETWRGLGEDYIISLKVSGDRKDCSARLMKWYEGLYMWKNIKDLKPNIRSGIDYVEIWVSKQDIGYTSSGINFRLTSYCYFRPDWLGQKWSYVIGSAVKQISVDGDPSDWDSIAPLVVFPPRTVNPPEFEISSVYIANDDENLYFRVDTREKPTQKINEGDLHRMLDVYLDTDILIRIEIYRVDACYVSLFKLYESKLHDTLARYNCTFNDVFEFKIPFKHLGISSGQKISVTLGEYVATFGRFIPMTGYLTYSKSRDIQIENLLLIIIVIGVISMTTTIAFFHMKYRELEKVFMRREVEKMIRKVNKFIEELEKDEP
jgi:hypothetical protein